MASVINDSFYYLLMASHVIYKTKLLFFDFIN